MLFIHGDILGEEPSQPTLFACYSLVCFNANLYLTFQQSAITVSVWFKMENVIKQSFEAKETKKARSSVSCKLNYKSGKNIFTNFLV